MMLRASEIEPLLDRLGPEARTAYDDAQQQARELAKHAGRPGAAHKQLEPYIVTHTLLAATGVGNINLPTVAELHDAERRALLDEEIDNQRRRTEARQILAAEQAAQTTIPTPVNLEQYIDDYADEETAWRVEGLWPAGGRVLVAGPPKAGKTTLDANLLRSLADGDPFLDRFGVEPAAGGVTLIDTEMSRGQLAHWLDLQNIQHQEHISVLNLRGAESAFNILDPATRTKWARTLEGSQVVILDNLRPVLDGIGLDENREAGRFLTAWDELMAEAGAEDSLIVTHMGHNGERARGDSALQASNDARWYLLMEDPEDGRSRRYFKANGRDVDFSESLLAYDEDTHRLSIAGGSRRQQRMTAEATAAALDVLAYLRDNPGGEHTGNKVETALKSQGHGRNAVRAGMRHALEQGWTTTRAGKRNSTLHDLAPAGVAQLSRDPN